MISTQNPTKVKLGQFSIFILESQIIYRFHTLEILFCLRSFKVIRDKKIAKINDVKSWEFLKFDKLQSFWDSQRHGVPVIFFIIDLMIWAKIYDPYYEPYESYDMIIIPNKYQCFYLNYVCIKFHNHKVK